MEDRSQTATTVLVVDDEPILRETIAYNLKREGFNVDVAADGEEALEIARDTNPDVIVLDIMLPKMDGLQVLRTIRDESPVPILLLSARSDEIDRVLGLELGADDYLPKPFAMRELVARVKAMVRRMRLTPEEAPPVVAESDRQLIQSGALSIDVLARRAVLNDVQLELKPKEFDLLLYLARRPGIVISRDALLREVWGYDYPVDTRTIDVHIRGIRQEMEGGESRPAMIETVRGYGYRFVKQTARI